MDIASGGLRALLSLRAYLFGGTFDLLRWSISVIFTFCHFFHLSSGFQPFCGDVIFPFLPPFLRCFFPACSDKKRVIRQRLWSFQSLIFFARHCDYFFITAIMPTSPLPSIPLPLKRTVVLLCQAVLVLFPQRNCGRHCNVFRR